MTGVFGFESMDCSECNHEVDHNDHYKLYHVQQAGLVRLEDMIKLLCAECWMEIYRGST
jgi:hypothetical protein